ncbi:MAG TPA: methyltransferase domain-containing protein [Solirubrobacteraceae bacterium]|nr:methyltransferase domain-containing protein [Solirubrobacteraceae bacterium]
MQLSTAPARRREDRYALARTPEEYERLRLQSRAWETATGRLLEQIGLAPGARCLDAGCGPGETMRLMAERVGPAGLVTGIDVDAHLGAQALRMLQNAGHRQCRFARIDITAGEPIPDAPFDLVYARLLLFHLPDRVTVLRRLWDAVAPGGHLLIHDYDLRTVGVLPALDSIEELERVIIEAFSAVGCDVRIGARLPELFARAGVGPPDGTDVSGHLEPLADARRMFSTVYRSVLPTAIAHGITTEQCAAATLSEVSRDAERFPARPALWPLLVGAWKHKTGGLA